MGTTWDELHKVIKVNIDTGGNLRLRSAVQTLPVPLRPPCSTMQRITSLAAFRELGGLAARSPTARAWKKGSPCSERPTVQRQWACWYVCSKRPFSWTYRAEGQMLCRRRFVFATQNNSTFCSQPGADGPRGNSDLISVVGIPDPITWIRCKVTMFLIKLYFGVDTDCVEFNRGVKQVPVTACRPKNSHYYNSCITALLSVSISFLPNLFFQFMWKLFESLLQNKYNIYTYIFYILHV